MEGRITHEGTTFIVINETKLKEVIESIFDEKIGKMLTKILPHIGVNQERPFFADYITKSEVRNEILSASTLHKHERGGRLKTYAIGGKKYYKRSEIESLMEQVKNNTKKTIQSK